MQGRRYAITGPNGSGKSTFMKILTGEIEPSKGSVTRPKKVGILRQDQFAFDAYRVLDTVIMGNAPLWDALQEREKFYANPNDWTDEDGMRLGELEGIVGDQGGYTAEADAATLLQGLDIPEALHERKMSELQSGQKVRVCWRRRCSATRACCCWTSPPTTWISIRCTGCKGTCWPTRAA